MSRPLLVVLRPLGLGDLLTGVPALRGLRAAFPAHRLTLAAPGPLAPLALATGAVDAVADVAPLASLPEDLSDADLAVDLHGKGPESHRVLLAARPQRLLAFRHPEIPESSGLPQWRPREHEVERWCRLLADAGIPADPGNIRLDPRRLPRRPRARGCTIVHPGAASGARRWPPARFAAVARRERAAGREVLVTGSPRERELARAVAEAAELAPSAVVAGATDLLELAALVGAAGRVVCGDTGVAHLATALGTPSVVVFGPTSPAEWGPRENPERHRVLWAGGTGDPHAPVPGPGLLAVGVRDVVEALEALDERPPRASANEIATHSAVAAGR